MYYIIISTNIDSMVIEQFLKTYGNIYNKVVIMEKIFTIGYEGKTPDEFLKVLKEAEISIVVDVRENPASRKKGFSKKTLSATLNDNGIQYRHIAELGTPKDIRVEYQNSGNIERLLEQYRTYLTENPLNINILLDAIGNNTAV